MNPERQPSHRRPLHVLVAERDDELRRDVAAALRDRGFATSETIEPDIAWGIAPFMDIVVVGDCLACGDTVETFVAELRALRVVGLSGSVNVVPLTTMEATVDACVDCARGEAMVPG